MNYLSLALCQAIIATVGSLYFSEVLNFPPCILCWYQRICLYPLVLIIGMGIYKKITNIAWIILPLASIGWCISLYHNLLYYKILPESIAPCQMGISCTTKFIEWFGFLTIPLLALIAFTIIIICTILYTRTHRRA